MFAAVADGERTIKMSAMEGDSVILHTNITQLQNEDQILWMLKNNSVNNSDTVLAKVYKRYNISSIYNDKLKLNSQTGSLTIMRITDSGLYQLEMINSNGTLITRFCVIVCEYSEYIFSTHVQIKYL